MNQPLGAIRPASWIRRHLEQLWGAVQPRPVLLEGEYVHLTIRMAPYRDVVPTTVLRRWWVVLGLAGLVTLGLALTVARQHWPTLVLPLPIVLSLSLLVWAWIERLAYNQWQIVITNRRTILYMPVKNGWPRVDSISLQAGRIQVIDTSWSKSWLWRPYQYLTGSRDLVLGMGGYVFKEGQAEVAGGLVMPDVSRDDILQMQELIFPNRKP